MTPRTLVLFDIDGTLLTSSAAGRAAIRQAFESEFDSLDFFEQVRFDGKTDPQIVRELFAAAGEEHRTRQAIAPLLDRYLVNLEEELALRSEGVRPLPGILPLLDELESRPEVCLGLLTGNIRPGARLKLEAAGIGFDRFRVGAFGSDHEDRPMLPPIAVERAVPIFGRMPTGAEVVIIGDTPADVTCGAGLGVRAVAVATGSYRTTELIASGAHATFESFHDTVAAVQGILAAA